MAVSKRKLGQAIEQLDQAVCDLPDALFDKLAIHYEPEDTEQAEKLLRAAFDETKRTLQAYTKKSGQNFIVSARGSEQVKQLEAVRAAAANYLLLADGFDLTKTRANRKTVDTKPSQYKEKISTQIY